METIQISDPKPQYEGLPFVKTGHYYSVRRGDENNYNFSYSAASSNWCWAGVVLEGTSSSNVIMFGHMW